MPRINIDLGGYVTIFMGSSVFEDDAKKLKNNWQYKDVRGFQQAQSHIEKKGIFGEYMSKYNLAKDFYKTKGWKFMGESKIDVGIFIVATGRWNLDEDVPDVKSKVVKLKVGSGITAAYSFSWVVSYTIGPVPLYVSFTLGIAAGFAVEHALSFCWVNGRFQNWELRPYNECTISINISLAAALGVGIKGFLDAWVEISTVLSIIIRLSITSKTPSNTTVEGEVKLSIGATIFILSFRKDWVLTKGVIWSSNQASNLLDAYMNADKQKTSQTHVSYADDASESSFLSLPLYESATSNRRAQTITLPVNALVDEPEEHRYARVVLSVLDTDENAYANNEFDVLFDHVEDLSIIDQPEDVTVQEGEDVSFDVEVDGGVEPYAYQWQVWDPVHEKWVDLPGFTDPVLSREDIEMRWDGCRFRCVITDAEGTQVISGEGTLTLRDRVPTGDDSHLPLYLIVAAVAIVLLMALRRRREVG
ncbi:MAG: hypothetical protein IKE17_03610 [Clostridia bacterium]|nr:hypothetical protein [Clostridia bacterium]